MALPQSGNTHTGHTHTGNKPSLAGWLLVIAGALLPFTAGADTLIHPWEASWHYLDDGTDQGTAWRAAAFDDSGWSSGLPNLGYGVGNEITVINGGHTTNYFRHTFTVNDLTPFNDLTLYVLRDDGCVVYINGVEVFRSNMPAGTIAYDTPATSENLATSPVVTATLPVSMLHNGSNTVAVELHQSSPASPDAAFTLAIIANPAFDRAPYLQMVTPTSAVISWGTATLEDSVVHVGTDPANLSQTVTLNTDTHRHEVTLTGLTPGTTYYYDVGSSGGALYGGTDYFFRTQPPLGSTLPTRIWVIGDSGRGNQEQLNTYQAYRNFAGSTYTDLWIMLGDNAYGSGTDEEYQFKLFNIYSDLMRNTVVWPALGNHDGMSVNTNEQTGAYYNIFALPKNGEAGGVPSGTEAYYAYNYGNIHFVVLDSYDVDRSATGAMASWLAADLEANSSDWVIVYWHHPPYSKGTHDSDDPIHEIELVEMRENILPIVEQHGVDLVLSGHSHNYERSKFVQGHYGYSNTYSDALFAVDAGSGNPMTGGLAYSKAHPALPNSGTVYAVAGTSAWVDVKPINHPVMYQSYNEYGSLVIDQENLVLTGRFIDAQGAVRDSFTIQKLTDGPDRDGDTVANAVDNCPLNANQDQLNNDDDSAGNVCDSDDDNDGVADGLDAFPLDASETADFDGDGTGDNADGDDDNDGVTDAVDSNPFNPDVTTEVTLPINSGYRGSRITEKMFNQ